MNWNIIFTVGVIFLTGIHYTPDLNAQLLPGNAERINIELDPALQVSCEQAVQGKIARDYNDNKTWTKSNLDRLCNGAISDQPAHCFQRVMHTGINWGGGTQWSWENAIDLCERTVNANLTITCFQEKINNGQGWQSAISDCSFPGLNPPPIPLDLTARDCLRYFCNIEWNWRECDSQFYCNCSRSPGLPTPEGARQRPLSQCIE